MAQPRLGNLYPSDRLWDDLTTPTEHPSDSPRSLLFAVYGVIIGLALLLRVVSAGWFTTIQGILSLFLFNSFVGSLCLGLFLNYLLLPIRKLQLAGVLLAGLLFEAILGSYRLALVDRVLLVLMFGVGLGASSLIFGLIPRVLKGGGAVAQRHLQSPVLMLCSYFVGHFTVGLVAQLGSMVYDLYAFEVDLAYGWAAAFKIRHWLNGHPPMGTLSNFIYGALALAMVASQLSFLRRPFKYHLDPTLCFVLLGTAGGTFYFVCPMVGPEEFFSKAFPAVVPPSGLLQAMPFLNLDTPRSCIPSLHVAWALSCWWVNWRAHVALRWGLGVFFVLTVPAALSTGHYLIDAVTAFPLTMGVHSFLCWMIEVMRPRKSPRLIRMSALAALSGLIVCTLSVMALRWFPEFYLSNRLLLWLWTLFCIGGSWWIEASIRRMSMQRLGESLDSKML